VSHANFNARKSVNAQIYLCIEDLELLLFVKRSCAFLFLPHILHVFLLSDLSSIFKSVFCVLGSAVSQYCVCASAHVTTVVTL